MAFTPDKLKTARDSGYTDDEIWDFLGKDDQRFNLAKENGYSLDETITTFSSVSPAPAAEPEPERRAGGGITGGAADIGVSFMKGLGTGTRMISDVFGANNPVSQKIAGYEDYMDSLLSAESKQDSQEISRILKDAEGKGILPQVMAGLEAFTVAPAEMTATTMGMMLPNLAGGVYAKAAQLTKAGVIGLQMGIGAAQGAGSVKGQIYTAVQEELRQQGLPEDQIDKVATEAQAYNGKNLDQILLGAGLGAAASSTGAEKIMTRLITGAGKEATEDIIKATIKGGLAEAPIEALQGGQEKVAENVALQRIGVDVPTMQGVIPAATMEATAGLLIGGGLGGVEAFVSPEKKEEIDIDKQADQAANEFLAPTDPTSQAIVKELARRENAVKNLQEAYDVLEPTSQEAQKLKLELGDAQRKLSAYKEIANKAGLSLPITTAEQRQIELAKEIAAPAEVAPEVAAPVEEAVAPPVEPTPVTPAPPVTEAPVEIEAVHYSRTPMKLEKGIDVSKIKGAYEEESTFGRGFYAAEKADEATWKGMGRFELGDFRNEVKIAPKKPLIISPETVRQFGYEAIKARIDNKDYDAIITRGWSEDANQKIEQRVKQLWTPKFPLGKTSGRFTNVKELEAAEERAIQEIIGLPASDYMNLDKDGWNQNQIFIPPDIAPDVVSTTPVTEAPAVASAPAAEAPVTEVAPIQRDVTRLEQMTPEEVTSIKANDTFVYEGTEYPAYSWTDERGRKRKVLINELQRAHKDNITQAAVDKSRRSPVSATAVESYGITLPEGYTKQGDLYVYQPTPAVSETITPAEPTGKPQRYALQQLGATSGEWRTIQILPNKEAADAEQAKLPEGATGWRIIPEPAPTKPAPSKLRGEAEAAPAGIAVGSRIKLGKSPQTYTIEEVLPQSATEQELGEQYYSVKNERTGEVQTVEAGDLRQVKGKGARKLFAGERAETPQFMRDSLNTARAMAAAGKTTEEIRAVTGWFPGMDGKMRWEIPDQDARLITPKTKNRLQRATEWLHSQGVPMNLDVGSPKVDQELRKKSLEYADQNIPQFNLSDILQHESLYAAYPEARNIPIEFQTSPEYAGMYEPARGVISIGEGIITDKSDAKLSTLLHEIQHWIQQKEIFAKGGSPNPALSGIAFDSKKRKAFERIYKNLIQAASKPLSLEEYSRQAWGMETPNADVKKDYQQYVKSQKKPSTFIVNEIQKEAFRKLYRNLAGEIEARDVESRKDFTQEQRNAISPYSSENISEAVVSMQQEGGAASEVSPAPEGILITPPDQRYTFEEVFDVAYNMFGGEIPEGFTIVNDSTNKDFEFKAAYVPESGEIIVNLAYLNRNDDIRDAITHELGHYIYGDPEFRAAFDQFISSLSPEARADLDAYVDTAYNKETGEIRLEEKMVRAFVDQFINEEQAPMWRTMLNAIKRFLNKLGFKFNISDRDAISVFTAALNRYKAGEAISREGGARKMAAAQPAPEKPAGEKPKRREKIMGVEAGPFIETQDGIIAKTKDKLKTLFDPEVVNETNTSTAYRAIGILSGANRDAARQYAESINALTAEGLGEDSDTANEISMGAALFVNNLFEYAVKLAAKGDRKMLGLMVSNINKLPTGQMGASDAGRTLRARLELKARFLMMAQAEQDAFTNYVAEFIYGPNPTEAQIKSIKDAYSATQKVTQPTTEELTEEIAKVGEKTNTDLVSKINDDFTKAAEKTADARDAELKELSDEYNKIQDKAETEIEKLAEIQSDTPSFARRVVNEIRAIVSADLKQKPDMGRKAPWKSMLIAKLQNAGVNPANAETLADLVWRQHEINATSRELDSINKAIEKGPISEIIKQIKDTPIEQQQAPDWRYKVMRDYLRKAGLSMAQAERVAKLMDISLQKRFTEAKEKAFTESIEKSAPWKSGDARSKRAFQQVIKAIRAGALDPSRNFLNDVAAINGWTGFTDSQYAKLIKLDSILSDPKSSDADKAEAHKAIQNIISNSKLPIRARDVIGQFYDAQALSGIPTITVNMVSPIGMAAKNALVQAASGVATFRPDQIDAAFRTLMDSIKSWVNTVAYSFKNNVTVYSNVEYLVNDEGLLKLYNRGKEQFKNGKTPKDRADGVKNMMVGMWDYVRRILNALDYGAIASLQNQTVPKYALAAMQAKGMSSKDGTKMLNAMFEAKRNFYEQQIAAGVDKNKASVLADEFFVSSWRQALTDAKLPAQQVIDSAINDAMSAVGRTRASLDNFRDENTNLQDAGVTSLPALWLLQTMANAANKSDSQLIKIFARIIYGFAVVPARVFRETAWFSPYGYVRFAYDAIAKKRGLNSPYAQSLGNDLQYRQRMNEATAGTLVMLGLASALVSSIDDEDDERPFKIVVTGNGPNRADDPQFYDSWIKNNTPNSVRIQFGKTKFTINTMRGFEAFAWPAMMLGAVDDWQIRRKMNRKQNEPVAVGDAAVVAGNVFSAALKRGPYAFAAKPLFESYGDRTVESLFKSLAFPVKTLIPGVGSSLARNFSDLLNEPIDRRTLDGALWANVPFIGPTVAPKALNAFGEPALAGEASDKLFKLGVPIVFKIGTDRDSVNIHNLVLKQGSGPSIPTRNQLAKRLDREPTNKEYELFVKEYGSFISEQMKKRYKKYDEMKPETYDKAIQKLSDVARDRAERVVRRQKKP